MTRGRLFLITLLSFLGLAAGNFLHISPENDSDILQNRVSSNISSKMTYGRFLDYLDMGWIKTADFYENGKLAIVEASSPELGDRSQKIEVEIPVGVPPLVEKLRQAQVNFTLHEESINNSDDFWTNISNTLVPGFFLVVFLFLFFRGSSALFGGANQFMELRKARAKVQLDANTGVLFEDVAGIEEAKEEFREVVNFLQQPQRFISVGAKIPKGVILVGAPGTGKTLLAKAIAGEAGVPFLSISASEFIEMFVGVGASRVRDLFQTAQNNAPCIVFIDEIDAIGRQRGTGVGSANDEREQTLNQLLTEMDGFEVNTGIILLAATNRPDILDPALLRPGRFDRQVNINLPDIRERVQILKVHARNKPFKPSVSLENLAQRTPGFSGADLANVLNEAAILAARYNKKSIGVEEVNTAIDRVIAGLEGTPLTDSKNKRLIAYHEIGHAIAATLLKHHDDVQKVTLIPRGQASGLTWFTPNQDQFLVSRSQILSRMIGALAGRAAEVVIFGKAEITTGASSDIEQVTGLARQMVTRYGMSSLGPLSLENQRKQVLFGRVISTASDYSENVTNRIDQQIEEIIKYCYEISMQIIKTNRVLIDQLTDILIEVETIEGEDFRSYVRDYRTIPEKFTLLNKKKNKFVKNVDEFEEVFS